VLGVFDGQSGSHGSTADRFPDTPFPALVCRQQTIPIFSGPDQNAEVVTVVDISGDDLTVIRGESPIAISASMQISALASLDIINLGQPITVSDVFATPNPPYTITLNTPGGAMLNFGPLDGVTDGGAGKVSFRFTPEVPGQWSYRFSDADGLPRADRKFFVRFTDLFESPDAPVASAVEIQYVADGWEGDWDGVNAYLEGDIVLWNGVVYQAQEPVSAGGLNPATDTANWVVLYDPTAAPPTLLPDSTGPLVDNPEGSILVCFDIGAWGNAALDQTSWAFQWQSGDSSDPDDPSWANSDPLVNLIDGPFMDVADGAAFHRCVVIVTNFFGTASATSPAV
jgi:hypothetical protein